MPKNSLDKNKLIGQVEKLFENILAKNLRTCQFNSLIERFINGLIDVVIKSPLNAEERKKRILKDFVELSSLPIYYANFHGVDAPPSTRQLRQFDFFQQNYISKICA